MSRALVLAAALGSIAVVGAGVIPLLPKEAVPDTWLRLRWPRELDPDDVAAFLRHLGASRTTRPLCFEASARSGHHLEYRVGVPASAAKQITRIFTALLPGVLVEPIQKRAIPSLQHALELRLSSRERALRSDAPEEVARSIASALANTSTEIVVQCLIGPRLAPQHVAADSTGLPTTGRWLLSALSGSDQQIDARAASQLRDKIGEHGFLVAYRIGAVAGDRKVAHGALCRVVGAIRVAEGSGSHIRVRVVNASRVVRATQPRRWSMALNTSELSGLLAWPFGDAVFPGVERLGARRLPAPSAVPSKSRVIGEGSDPRTPRPIGLAARDGLMHMHAIGPTGVGKSTLLANLIVQDIHDGRGVVVIEPKGDLVDNVLTRVPAERADDVVLLDPSDPESVVGLNPLSGSNGELAADQLMAVFHGLYSELGPRTTDVLHASLLTLTRAPGATMPALPLLLSDERYRRTITSPLNSDLALGPFWAWYEGLSEPERNHVIAPAMNKLRPFLLRSSLRAVLAQATPRFDVSQVFTERKIMLVALRKGQIGSETAQLLGSLVVAMLWRAAQARSAIDPERRHPVFCYVDEFQDYLHLPTDLADVLATSRGLGMGLVLAHQHLAQLTPSVRAGVLANARSRVCFRLSAEDASTIAKTTELLDARDFQSLGRYETYTSLVADGTTQSYCSTVTRPLSEAVGNAGHIRALSRERYGTPRADVEAELHALIHGEDRQSPKQSIGKQRRGRT